MADMLAEVKARHFAGPPASPTAVTRLEERIGCVLPADLRQLYLEVGPARLFSSDDPAYRMLGPESVRWVGVDVHCGKDPRVPRSWLSICDVQDGNYVAIDLPPKPSGEVWFIDCFHETTGEPGHNKIIAVSFTEFLERALVGGRIHYWLESDFGGYGDALDRSS